MSIRLRGTGKYLAKNFLFVRFFTKGQGAVYSAPYKYLFGSRFFRNFLFAIIAFHTVSLSLIKRHLFCHHDMHPSSITTNQLSYLESKCYLSYRNHKCDASNYDHDDRSRIRTGISKRYLIKYKVTQSVLVLRPLMTGCWWQLSTLRKSIKYIMHLENLFLNPSPNKRYFMITLVYGCSEHLLS